jgi:hypothetical protein
MPHFIVTTDEMVKGRYKVWASTEKDARKMFQDKPGGIDWSYVEQIDYEAYALDIQKIDGPFKP